MINGILDWVKNIALYIILITLILQILPERYRKYVGFFTGVLLMLLTVKPALKLFKLDSSFAGYFQVGEMGRQLKEMSQMLMLTKEVGEERLIESYNEQIKENITALLSVYGFQISDIRVDWNLEEDSTGYGSIKSISITLREKGTAGTTGIGQIAPIQISIGKGAETTADRPEIAEMKKALGGFYNLEEAHINITVQG